MSQNRFWNLLAKKLSGEAEPEELNELEQLLRENPDWMFAAEHLQGLWKVSPKNPDLYDAEMAFELHLNQLKEQGVDLSVLQTPVELPAPEKRPASRKRYLAVSMFTLLLVAAALTTWKFSGGEQPLLTGKKLSEVSTRMGSKSTKLVLPDSTVVWLNAGSKLTYNETFGIDNRNTTLTGEAFFDVKKSTTPFIIHANSVQIKVLGTAFNVKSYPNEHTTETSLIRGTVEVTLDKRPGEKFILKPNEKLVVANEMEVKQQEKPTVKKEPIVVLGGLTHAPDNTIIETSWLDNKLIFQDESFADIARKMQRWYGVTIDILNEQIAALRLTGTFENETIRQALEALQITEPFHFTIEGNRITITQ